MCVLSQENIAKKIKTGVIQIVSDLPSQFTDTALTLNMDYILYYHDDSGRQTFESVILPLNINNQLTEQHFMVDGSFFCLQPDDTILAFTYEHIQLPDGIIGSVEMHRTFRGWGIQIVCDTPSGKIEATAAPERVPLLITNVSKKPVKFFPLQPIALATFMSTI